MGVEEDVSTRNIATRNGSESLMVLWKEKLSNLTFCHGTSREVAEQIKGMGIKGVEKPYSSEDQFFIEDQAFLWGIRDGAERYAQGKGNTFFLSVNENAACSYAVGGPEMVRLYLLPTATMLEEKMAQVIDNPHNRDYQGDYERVVGIRRNWLEKTWNHEPALVRVKRGSPSFDRLLTEKLGGLRGGVDSYEGFMGLIHQYRESGVSGSDEEIGKMIIDEIRGRLNNVPIIEDVPPEDFDVITGEEFDGLNKATRESGIIRNACRESIGKAPPELVSFLEGVLVYKTGKMSELGGLCKYYGIGAEEMKKMLARVAQVWESL